MKTLSLISFTVFVLANVAIFASRHFEQNVNFELLTNVRNLASSLDSSSEVAILNALGNYDFMYFLIDMRSELMTTSIISLVLCLIFAFLVPRRVKDGKEQR